MHPPVPVPMGRLSAASFALALVLVAGAPAHAADPHGSKARTGDAAAPQLPASARAAFERQAKTLEAQLKGEIGVSMRLIETGEEFSLRGDERFPMASTYKVAIAGAALARVDRGELALDRLIAVTPRHVAETGPIATHVEQPGVALSLANLIELMLRESNNNATDRVLESAGGPAAVNAWVRAQGIADLRVDSTVNDILNRYLGFPPGTPAMAEYERRYPTPEAQAAVDSITQPAFDADPADTSTPRAMTALVAHLYSGQGLSKSSRDFLVGIMEKCDTGKDRLKGLLPADTVVAHKTGTIGGTVNDTGVITLPDGRHLAISVLTRRSTLVPYTSRERALAEIARSAYDYFTFR